MSLPLSLLHCLHIHGFCEEERCSEGEAGGCGVVVGGVVDCAEDGWYSVGGDIVGSVEVDGMVDVVEGGIKKEAVEESAEMIEEGRSICCNHFTLFSLGCFVSIVEVEHC